MRFLDETGTSAPGFKSRVVPLYTFEIHAQLHSTQVQNVNRPTEPMSALYQSGLFALTLAISAVLHRSQGAYTQSHGTPRPNLCATGAVRIT